MQTLRALRRVAGLLLLLALPPAGAGAAGHPPATADFLPPGALSYEDIRLDNGLRIVAQRVHSAPYVSLRLVVKTGMDHYPCDDRELPHLVEHLLFSANASKTEGEIEDDVGSWGGMINAYTYAEQTDLVLDVHARFRREAVTLAATLARDFAPDEDDVARERTVVEREAGAEITPLRLWWTRQPFVHTAFSRFLVAAGLDCDGGLRPLHHLTLADVRRAYDTYYVPANMVLVLVGDLDDDTLALAREAFGSLPARPAPALPPVPVAMPAADDFVSGWLSGTASLDAPTATGIAPFTDWEGYYALMLAEDWLNDRLFRELRSERGIAYTPSASVEYVGTATVVTLTTETAPADTGATKDYLRALVGEVARDGIPPEDFERLRTGALLGMAQSFERISDRADYLAASIREIESGGLFDVETFYEQLDYPRFRALLARDWPPRFAVMDASPRVTWSAWMALLGGSVLLLATALGIRLWQRLREARPG